MQAGQVLQLRQRKIELYASLLPRDALPPAISNLSDDGDYAAALIEIARIAPPGFGLTVGMRRRLSDLGVLGHVTMSCATIGEVFRLWMIYAENAGELATFDAAMDTHAQPPSWSILIKPYPYLPRNVADLLTDELSATFFVFGREMTGIDFVDFAVELPHAEDPAIDYAKAFPGRVTFDAKVACVVGPATALDLPIRQNEGDALSLLVEQLGGDRSELQQIRPVTLQLYDFLVRRRGTPPTLAGAAAALRLSERTLVRRLAAEETSYGLVLDDFRRRYALTLAQYGGLKAKQISHLVGFRSENGLRKAFKNWTGQPIGRWSQPTVDRSHDLP